MANRAGILNSQLAGHDGRATRAASCANIKNRPVYVWGAISIVIAMMVYFPFAKAAERQRLKAEAAGVAHE
jgi:hypothetical protein